MAKITVGMPTYEDFDGVYFSVNALRLYHPELRDDMDIIVVDNKPDGKHGPATKKFVESIGARYVPFTEWTSTSVGKNIVFKLAAAPYVVCIDSHVMIEAGALSKLLVYFAEHPDCTDLLQGPMVNNGFSVNTHFEPVWRGQMWGIWRCDDRGKDPSSDPFEIPMQGTGLMACRKEVWPGFSDLFRGFGGQAGYIHTKFKQAGAKTMCLPFLRWMHRFGRPEGAKYGVKNKDKFRNYVVGFSELGMDLEPVRENFREAIPESEMDEIIEEVGEQITGNPTVACLMLTYNRLPRSSDLINEAIESFLRQTYKRKELIIVNDCPGQIINYSHPNVTVVNVSRRFDTLGEKFNFAASMTKADLLCIWDDDDIVLPDGISMAVNGLGDGRYWQPDGHWIMNNGDLTFIDRKGQLPGKGIFTHELFDELGGFREVSYRIDRDFQNRAKKATDGGVFRVVGPGESQYIYRYAGTGSYHHTSAEADKYEQVGELPIEECIFIPDPFWAADYRRMVDDACSIS